MESAKKSYSHATYLNYLYFMICNYTQTHFYSILAFTMEQDIPDYDIDSEDEKWINSQAGKLDIAPLQVFVFLNYNLLSLTYCLFVIVFKSNSLKK